ncbi:S66 peptidase family protein [Coleofasciculus sp. G2-EDA-02]|uniref:S66 peptidase family protein n=1 Tax=Coleofasciculus sp. G2-EDA-02 TaxID=3069529 RepID=UPI0033036F65
MLRLYREVNLVNINQLYPLQSGDLLRVIAPSGALREVDAFHQGVEIWRRRGYRVELPANWDARDGYLAGTDNQRRQQLAAAWYDPECQGILCTRGGYGSARLLEDWTWTSPVISPQVVGAGLTDNATQETDNLTKPALLGEQGSLEPKSPIQKWLIGFSDITCLLWSLAGVGIGSVHGPVLTTLASEPEWSLNRLFDCVEGRSVSPLTGKGWGGGKVRGWLLPGNLTVATHLLSTPILPPLDGAILALEDVTEAPYRIDRLLTQWRMSGMFQKVKGIALGRFSRCYPPQNVSSWTVEKVLRDRLSDLDIPIVSDFPFGHDGVNAALPVGRWVELDGDQGTLCWKN